MLKRFRHLIDSGIDRSISGQLHDQVSDLLREGIPGVGRVVRVRHAHRAHVVQGQASPEVDVLLHGDLERGRDDLGQEIAVGVHLMTGHRDVEGVSVRQTVALVNRTPGHVKHVSRFQDDIHDRIADLVLLEVGAGEPRQRLVGRPRLIQPPVFLALQLQDEDLDVVIVGCEPLRSRGCQVHVGADEAADKVLQSGAQLPDGFAKSLRVEHAEAAAVVVKVPDDSRVGPALRIVRFPLVVDVGRDIEILGELDVLIAEDLVEDFRGEQVLVKLALTLPLNPERSSLPSLVEEIVRIERADHPSKEIFTILERTGIVLGDGGQLLSLLDRHRLYQFIVLLDSHHANAILFGRQLSLLLAVLVVGFRLLFLGEPELCPQLLGKVSLAALVGLDRLVHAHHGFHDILEFLRLVGLLLFVVGSIFVLFKHLLNGLFDQRNVVAVEKDVFFV